MGGGSEQERSGSGYERATGESLVVTEVFLSRLHRRQHPGCDTVLLFSEMFPTTEGALEKRDMCYFFQLHVNQQ